MRVFYAIGLLLLINEQVNTLSTTLGEEDIYNKSEEWWNKSVEDLINEVTEASALIEKRIADGQLKLEKSTADAFLDLHTWQELIGADCYQQGIQQLEILKKASISEFFHCDRLKEGLQDIGQMFKETFHITLDVEKEVAPCLAGCALGSKVIVPVCVAKCFWDFIGKIKSLVPEFKAYGLDMKRLATEIKEIYYYCANQTEHKVNPKVEAILKGTRLCAINQNKL